MRRPTNRTRNVRLLLLAATAGVCLTRLDAQSHDFATVTEMQGQVSVLRNGQVALFPNSSVAPREQIVTGPDGYAKFRIADGSTFEVFQNSRVTFRDSFNLQELVNLVLGRIRVQIEHRNGPNPKKVSTPTAVISVRGTIFDVSVEDDDGTTLVAVEEGEVEVRNTRQPGPSVTVMENQSIRVFPNQPLARVRGGGTPGMQAILDQFKRVLIEVARNPGTATGPGGIPTGGPGGIPGQADGGKNKKGPPTTTPPTPPGPPGGGI